MQKPAVSLQTTVILSLLSHENTDHGPVVADFIQWYNASFLNINVVKSNSEFRLSGPAWVRCVRYTILGISIQPTRIIPFQVPSILGPF